MLVEVWTVTATGGYSKGTWTVVFQIPRSDQAGEHVGMCAILPAALSSAGMELGDPSDTSNLGALTPPQPPLS